MSPLIVGIGGTLRENSSSQAALDVALAAARANGARTARFVGRDLDIPHYEPGSEGSRSEKQAALISAFRAADGFIISSPGYHGTLSGLVKNALDYVEDLVNDERAYFAGLPVGCIGVAYGNQAAVAVVTGLRSITHALRGFPTPYGATVVVKPEIYQHGVYVDRDVISCLELVGTEVAAYAGKLSPAAARV
ncbi:NADPH-dependent FMN reductase [Mycolicibacterium vinylchloridicum]|uniref:NADPH-dependent FMN reductase n=1 Tax=Mycolicibacterium vinylchloridicum TaxID=2736928 RepID=UPI0015C90EB3|nr:NADPH-dependent FMN reductase [Mycolicibacterium vinylchloridicum]